MQTLKSQASGAEIAVASDVDIESIVVCFRELYQVNLRLTSGQCGDHIVDFATYLRLVKPPVNIDGTGEYRMISTANLAH